VHGYLAMTRTEFRLFRREPFPVFFVLAFPLMMMLMAAVFGNNRADAGKIQNGMLIWRGVTPANYYMTASVAGIVAALGPMTLPTTLASYRQRAPGRPGPCYPPASATSAACCPSPTWSPPCRTRGSGSAGPAPTCGSSAGPERIHEASMTRLHQVRSQTRPSSSPGAARL